ncbi:hypothetical protein H2200_008579 [Cladophialophora chaetospira]|uniref:SUZ domain-containing protein n=1 Tax=Cladophialophora chaetospira TaxID=386627 RepID=A0AA38X4G9_9EURO|nr:hypothetical protein H2200_008579 [Cladophialophora chaetospira]
MSKVPDAWDEEWSTAVDDTHPPTAESAESKKVSSKVTKAQRRAQQAEFNRQLWAQAEGPKETNYFLESRNVVPMRSEYKPPTVLLSRKGPAIQAKPPRPPTAGMSNLTLNNEKSNSTPGQESSEDEDESQARELTLAERQAQAAKEREEKQRRYEERRKELFGDPGTTSTSSSQKQGAHNKSGNSSPGNLTPPSSRSATPNRARGGRGGRRGGTVTDHNTTARNQPKVDMKQHDLYEPSYSAKPDSIYIQRVEREAGKGIQSPLEEAPQNQVQQPIRAPRGPDGSGRGGFGFTRTSKPVPEEAHTNEMDTVNTGSSATTRMGMAT